MQSAESQGSGHAHRTALLSRHDFREGFVFGTASSAFQYEGAPEKDGRGPSIWDTFLKKNYPDLVEKEKALDAIHFYDRYKEDVKIMKEMGIDSCRLSISWPRVLPNGRRTKGPNGEELGVNKSGIAFYKNLINDLVNNQIEPVVTLFHWDLAQTLETEYLGFLKETVVEDFCDYADLCFREFGRKVKKWITFNETWSFSMGGYLMGTFAPGRGASSEAERSFMADILPSSKATSKQNRAQTPTEGNPYVEIYTVTHNQLLAHAAAFKLYKSKYQKRQGGEIGITIVSQWFVPYTDKQEDIAAAGRALDFMLGWVLRPLIFGDYPESMRTNVGSRLPQFSIDLTGSFDFIGLNYYTANYARDCPPTASQVVNVDSQVICSTDKDGVPIGEKGGSDWLYSYPQGLKELLGYIADQYKNPPVYITENGIDELNKENTSFWEAFFDYQRVSYHYKHLLAMKDAMIQGANVKGYFAWSLMDNLEWSSGFQTRFGINYIYFNGGYERFPKLSAGWFKFLLANDHKN